MNKSHSYPVLSEIYVYPVKSCQGIKRVRSKIDQWGLEHDREWMVVDGNYDFVTQRSHPELARVRPTIKKGSLHLSAPGRTNIKIDDRKSGLTLKVEVWGDEVEAIEEDEASEWFSELLGQSCRLVRRKDIHHRSLKNNPNERNATVGFADTHPFLLVNRESVELLNDFLSESISVDRFRANLIVKNLAPFEEDYWSEIAISDTSFDVVHSKPRCKVITVDQVSGKIDNPELLALLGEKRESEEGVLFGRELIHQSNGWINKGSTIEVKKRRQEVEIPDGIASN